MQRLECGQALQPKSVVGNLYAGRGRTYPETQVLYGEAVHVEETQSFWGKWIKVRTRLDEYDGFMSVDDLRYPTSPPTHRVCVPVTSLFTSVEPTFKAPLLELGINSLVHVMRMEDTPYGMFAQTMDGWVLAKHLAPVGFMVPDYITTMEHLTGRPYGYGWRHTRFDCSGLVQAGMFLAGRPCPRNCGDQFRTLGEEVADGADLSILTRGDLVYFEDDRRSRHVVGMCDEKWAVHASFLSAACAVSREPLSVIMDTQAASFNGRIVSVRRLFGYRA